MSFTDDLSVIDLFMARLRLELFSALQHPNDRVRESAWEIVDDAVKFKPLLDKKETTPDAID